MSDVSDFQLVLSHAVCLPRTDTVVPTSPNPAPCKLTLAEPVAPPLLRPTVLALETSVDTALDVLPDQAATVRPSLVLLPILRPVRHLTDVPDSQLVCSNADPLTLAAALVVTKPMLAPCSVKLAEPVVTRLACRIVLIEPGSIEWL